MQKRPTEGSSSKARSRSRDWTFWVETRLVSGHYPVDSRLSLSKKAFYLYVSMLRRCSLRLVAHKDDETRPPEEGWFTSMGRNAFAMDTGLPIDVFDFAVKELEEKGFIRTRPEIISSPAYLKGSVYQLLPAPIYDEEKGFITQEGNRDLGFTFTDFRGIDPDGGDRPVFFCPADIVDKGYVKRLRSLKLLRLLLRLYSFQRLDRSMGIPQDVIKFEDITVPPQGIKKLAITNLNYVADAAIEPSALNRSAHLDRSISHITPALMEPLDLSKRELLQSLSDLCSLGLLHFALVEETRDPEDPDITISTVINPLESEQKLKKGLNKANKIYFYSPKPGVKLYYVCQLALKPNTVETERYMARVQQTVKQGQLVQLPS